MSDDIYDVAIIGAGPAGATAANRLAAKGRRVVLVERAKFPRPVVCAGWLNTRCAAMLDELGVKTKSLLKCAFRDVTFYRADFTQTTKPVFEEAPGYLIDRGQFDNALATAAAEQGAVFIQGCAVGDVQLKEDSVVLKLAGERRLEAKLLLVAAGRGTGLFERVGLEHGRGETPVYTALVDTPLTTGQAPKEPCVGVVLGLDDARSFGMCCLSEDRMSVGVTWAGDVGDVMPVLVRLCRQAFEHKVVPIDLSQEARSRKVIRSPVATALDTESHVGKHTLVIGDAGGFVAAASNEGIYPAMWSAQIAAEVIENALHANRSQDELISFDSAWRMQMADYLRSPHTDIHFLLPLIFSNQPMANRMGAAFFHGENI